MDDDERVNYGLGIDTGGTYTDAVIVDLRTKKVLFKAKARTTHHDLSIGLGEAVDGVLKVFGAGHLEPSLVGVSTTLATNSILEGKGGQVGLIGLGWTPKPSEEFGTKYQYFLNGGHDVRGRPQTSMDIDGVRSAVKEMASNVDSIVISSLFSVYNPIHEIEIKRIISEGYGIPVVMGHELTGELGIYERTVTAVLNARLIPVLSEFLQKVQEIMAGRGIKAPMMVLKGDGNLMKISVAKERPVETLLSGPAASAMGGFLLTDLEDCIAIDMGGTSTDIAVIEDGRCKVSREGAVVGSWPTRVEAVKIRTIGLGGDSEIATSPKKDLVIGPERVVPLCFASPVFPDIVRRIRETGEIRFLIASPRDFNHLNECEQRIIDRLRVVGPQTFTELEGSLEGIYLLDKYIRSLKARGAISVIGLTPTDVLHAAERYTEGDVDAAKLGVKVLAIWLGIGERELIDKVISKVTSRIAEEVLKKCLSDEMGPLPESDVVQNMIDGMSGARSFSMFSLNAKMDRPLVGLGAPAGAFISPLADLLNAKVVIPTDHDVGNAVGAVCGQVAEFVDVFVYPRDTGYAVYSAFSAPMCYGDESDTVAKAKELASMYAMERAEKAGGHNLQVELKVEEERERSKSIVNKDKLVQMWIRARAVGTPQEENDP
jgi:N-methylhydantoinase A/oxoprolinase/acetone carboxylase beta subunit